MAVQSNVCPQQIAINMATLGEKLKAKRTQTGKSLDALAKDAGLSKSYLWELENRESPKPSLDKLQAIASALNIDVAFFMDDSIEDLQEDLKDRQFFRNYSKLDPKTKEQVRVMIEALKKTGG
jgi:transcriptional regulator with XRE-family HTH domain